MSQDVCALSDITTKNFVLQNIVLYLPKMREKSRKTFGFIRLQHISSVQMKTAPL
jgi:hypothetical protein